MCCFGLACLAELICCCCDDDQQDQPGIPSEQPGWLGTGNGDVAMSEAPQWQQPPTEGWLGAGAGNIGVGDGGGHWEQPPQEGWVGAGQGNIGFESEQPQAGSVGVQSNNHM